MAADRSGAFFISCNLGLVVFNCFLILSGTAHPEEVFIDKLKGEYYKDYSTENEEDDRVDEGTVENRASFPEGVYNHC